MILRHCAVLGAGLENPAMFADRFDENLAFTNR
jgi:hypothetical protein